MNRDDFMKEARVTARDILQGKENGIMNLVQRAWAEGKRNAEVETLRTAIDEALDKWEPKEQPKEQPEDAVYPTGGTWLADKYDFDLREILYTSIPADSAEELGLQPKEE